MFAYCLNNPIRNIDISGCLPFENDLTGNQVLLDGGYGLHSGYTHFRGRPLSDLTFEFSDSVYDSSEYYPDSPAHIKLLSVDVSALSFEKNQVTIVSARGSLVEVDVESEFATASVYDLGIAELSLGVDNHTVYADAIVTAWNPNIDLDFGIFTLNVGAHVGSYGMEFSVGKDGITWGAAALFGYSVSIGF